MDLSFMVLHPQTKSKEKTDGFPHKTAAGAPRCTGGDSI
jgi:hypothetical protein